MARKVVSPNPSEQARRPDKDPAMSPDSWNMEPPDLEGLSLGEASSEEPQSEQERFLSSLVPQDHNDQNPGLSVVMEFELPYLAELGRYEPKMPGLSCAPAPRDRWDCSTDSPVSNSF